MNRIWIELERPEIDCGKRVERSIEQMNEIGNARAASLSRMLERLGCPPDYCFWMEPTERRPRGCYCFGGVMGFVEASDDGHWFNLDFLAGPEPKPSPLETDENIGSTAA